MPRIPATRQAATGIIAGDTSDGTERARAQKPEPTAKKTEIRDWLLAQGKTEEELEGLTKPQLAELL